MPSTLVARRLDVPATPLDRRRAVRFACSSQMVPAGEAPHPVRYKHVVRFSVRELSQSVLTVVLVSQDPSLRPGHRLNARLTFPGLGEVRSHLFVLHSRIEDDTDTPRQLLVVSVMKAGKLVEVAGQYLLQSCGRSPAELRREGFAFSSVAAALEFSLAEASEYRKVLRLRHQAYSLAGKVDARVPVESLGDAFDDRARIVVARHGQRIVGSMRLIYHGDDDRSEHEQFVELPQTLPPKGQMVEITRVCTDPDYRGSDLLPMLFVQAALAVLESGRRWIFGSATPKLLGLYERVGCVNTGVTYKHADLGGEEHFIFACDLPCAISGQNVNPVVWALLCTELVGHVKSRGLATFTLIERLRIALYRLLTPFSLAVVWILKLAGRSRSRRKP
jgi:predicted GNAT family N-acyltransferase